jgi:hypothetical protein
MPTMLEKKFPEVARKAEELGLGKIYYHDKEWWVGDGIQLTFRMMGKPSQSATSWEARRKTALRRLQMIEDGRKQPEWGDLEARIKRVIDGIKNEIIPTYRPRHFNHWRHPSLDEGVCFRDSIYFGTYPHHNIMLRLVGQKTIEVTERSWKAALIELEKKIATL